MSRSTQRALACCTLVMLIGIPSMLYFAHAFDYLSLTRPVSPEILVVEGWLPEPTIQKAKEEFLDHGYKLLLTTGFPYYNGFLMGSGGRMEFRTDNIRESPDRSYTVGFTTRGTKAKSKYAHFTVYADSIRLCAHYSSAYKKNYSCQARLDTPPKSISIVFDNDLYTRTSDRNLYLYSVSVNEKIYPADNQNVVYFVRKNGMDVLWKRLNSSNSTYTASYLRSLGIPDTLIVALETKQKIKSRTFTTALDVKSWTDNHMPGQRPAITIFTQSVHARRSYVSFRKAFGDKADIGVISQPDTSAKSSTWWKSIKGWRAILYETAGLLYAAVLL